MDQDEKVDGGRAAAQILNCMPPDKKKRLLKSIQDKSPEAFSKIEDNIFNFEDIVNITGKGLQRLIKDVEHKDLVLSLKKADQNLIDALLGNMSERKRNIVLEDLEALPKIPLAEVDAAQKRIVQKVDQLRAEGLIQTNRQNDVWV